MYNMNIPEQTLDAYWGTQTEGANEKIPAAAGRWISMNSQ